MDVPEGVRYSADHEWIRIEGDRATIGITDYAQDALGDVVYLELPDVGTTVAAGDKVSEVESTKSVSDIYAPVDGTVVEANEALGDNPELVNSSPYADGWICVIEMTDAEQAGSLLDAAGYQALLED